VLPLVVLRLPASPIESYRLTIQTRTTEVKPDNRQLKSRTAVAAGTCGTYMIDGGMQYDGQEAGD
jgi:hypothetical protein